MEDGLLLLLDVVVKLSSNLHEDCFLVAERFDHLKWWPQYEQRLPCLGNIFPLLLCLRFGDVQLHASTTCGALRPEKAATGLPCGVMAAVSVGLISEGLAGHGAGSCETAKEGGLVAHADCPYGAERQAAGNSAICRFRHVSSLTSESRAVWVERVVPFGLYASSLQDLAASTVLWNQP